MEIKVKSFRSFELALSISSVMAAGSAMAANSKDLPVQSGRENTPWVAVHIGKINGGDGHIGIDLSINGYNPGNNEKDNESFYGANCMANAGRLSYYKVEGFSANGANSFSSGIFIANEDTNTCFNANPQLSPNCASTLKNNNTPTIKHDWAKKVTTVSLEFYPHDAVNYGGIRIDNIPFTNPANGGVYSPYIGDVTLPRVGDPGVGRANGFFWKDGKPFAGNGREASFETFQTGDLTWKTSTGYPVIGFSSVGSNADGYYATSVIPQGRYKTYVSMTDKNADGSANTRLVILFYDVNSFHTRLDFHFEKPCFGWYPCLKDWNQ